MCSSDLEQGALADALEDYQQALRLQPDQPLALFLRAKALRLSGQDAAAMRALEDLIQKTPDYGEAYYEQSVLLERAGKIAEARDKARQARAHGFHGKEEGTK